jgi:hypothetical protein
LGKKRPILTPEQLAEWRRRSEETERVLREWIARYDAKVAEERGDTAD